MESLSGGGLLKLFEEMNTNRKSSDKNRKPVLLQIRSIIPILKDGNLWPNQGFYLRVADLTHAIYASLPQDQCDMILNDRLQLGQYIYVERLEKAYPVPVLVGLTPIPGRHFCVGKPIDLLKNNFLQHEGNFPLEAERKIVPEKKVRGKHRSVNPSSTRSLVGNKSSIRKGRKRNPRSGEDDSDSDCSSLSTVSSVSKLSRRNWKSSDLSSVKEITETTLVKHKTKSTAENRSASASPTYFAGYNNFDEKSCAKLEREISDQSRRLANSPSKSDKFSIKHLVSVNSAPISLPSKDNAQGGICWDTIPLALAKIGKEVLRQRDLALLAAAEALQEAAAAERLLKSLRTFSDLQSISQDSAQPSVDNFLKLQENLSQTKLIIRSLSDITTAPDVVYGNSKTKGSIKEVLQIIFERKKQASDWAKAAVTSDLSTESLPSQPPITPSDTPIVTSPPKPSPKQKLPSFFRRNAKNSVITSPEACTDYQHDSTKGKPSLTASTSFASSLEAECRKWFLSYIESYIDEIKSGPGSSDRQTVSVMNQLKQVNDWLDTITRKQPDSRHNNKAVDSWELQACGRVRNKIIMFLLNHVTRAALASGASSDSIVES